MLVKHTLCAAVLLAISAATAQAQQAAPANCATLKQVAAIKLEQIADGRWLVPISINGVSKKMILDTSAVASSIFSDYATETNMTLTDALPSAAPPPAAAPGGRGGPPGGGRGGPGAPVKLASITSFGLGTIVSGAGYFKVAPDARKDKALDPNLIGVLGTDLLWSYDFDLDFGTKTLSLFSADHCPGKVVYWSGPTVAVSFYVDTKGQLRFPVLVDGTELSGTLNSAAAQNGMSLVFGKKKLGFHETDAGFDKVATDGVQPAQYSHRFKSVDLGGLAVNNPLIFVNDDSKTNKIQVTNAAATHSTIMDTTIPDVVLGAPFMGKFHLYVETKEHMIYVTPAEPAKKASTD